MNSQRVDRVAIIGVGLIGGSFGMALKKRGLASEVIGIGRSRERLERAAELGAVDSWTVSLCDGVKDADLVYVATPVGMEIDFIRQAVEFAKSRCIITDAGSTKGEICRQADSLLPEYVRFVGGHPMAGSEATGVESAQPDLFVNATYVLTPTERTDPDALAVMRFLAEGIGSRVVEMDPESHDRCAAIISHLPHLMAAALVSLAQEHSREDPRVLDLIAGSFRDMTRVAGSSPELWRDICSTNVSGIGEAVAAFKQFLDQGFHYLESGDPEGFRRWFEKANEARSEMMDRPKRG